MIVSQDEDGRIWLDQVPKGIFAEMGEQPERIELVHYEGDSLIPVKADRGMYMPHAFVGDDGHGRALYLHVGRAIRRADSPSASARPCRGAETSGPSSTAGLAPSHDQPPSMTAVDPAVDRPAPPGLLARFASNPWTRFAVRRLGRLLVSLWVLITASFLMIHLIPGDPVRAALGHDGAAGAGRSRRARRWASNDPLLGAVRRLPAGPVHR